MTWRVPLQKLDSDASGDLSSAKFQAAIKKLVAARVPRTIPLACVGFVLNEGMLVLFAAAAAQRHFLLEHCFSKSTKVSG